MVQSTADARSPRVVALLLSLVVALALLPGAAAAVPSPTESGSPSHPADQTVGGDVVVGPDETVTDDLTVASGDVLVRGTVEGDVTAMAGSVEITGEVTDDVTASAGSVTIDGRVGGSVEAAAGSVDVGPDAAVDGDLRAAAGTVSVAGDVGGDVSGSETVRLEDGATVDGDVSYGETLDRADGATVGGAVVQDSGANWQFSVLGLHDLVEQEYGFVPSVLVGFVTGLVGLAVGALLLVLFPEFSAELVETVTTEPVRASAAGVATAVAVPAVLIALALTFIGIPLALAGGAIFALVAWIALVYGEYLVGARVLDAAGIDNRWAALVVGVVGVQALAQLPVFGDLVALAVGLLGLGTGALVLGSRWGGEDGDGSVETPPPDPAPGTA